MATVGLYGSSSSGVVASASGSESTGLYGNNVSFGGSYFEWFIFTQADTQPATPTGGSWDFTTNAGTPPAGWYSTPPSAPTNKVWVSIALVSSKNTSSLVWSAPGLFSYSSGLPILSGNGIPASGAGVSDQLYIQLDTAPQTIWFKESGTWTRLTGSSLYVDLTSNQTIAGTKTFSSTIQGSVSGTSSNVTGTVGITNGGTGSTTASGARTALGAAASGANSDITSLSGLTTPLNVAQGGTGATTASGALSNIGGIGSITSTDGSIIVSQVGTAVNVAVSEASPASTVLTPVRNTTGATLTKGTVVYISGATGQIATVSKALATSDATSAQTLGMITSDLANNSNGYVTVFGLLIDVDTSAYADGAQLYLSGTTAGAVTATKPSAPIHLVYVGVVEYSHAIHGKILVKVQNGYELDELHDVSITSVAAYNMLQRNSANTLWTNIAGPTSAVVGISDTQTLTNKTISGASNTLSNIPTSALTGTLGIANGGTGQTTAAAAITALTGTQTNAYYLRSNGTNASLSALSAADLTGTVSIASGGTGQTTANAAFNALAPSQTGNSGKYLTTDGTNTSWATNPLGTVTSVGGTGTVSGITLSGTVTTSGNLTLGGALDLSSPPAIGGTTPNSGAFTTLSASGNVTLSGGTANGVPYLNASKVLTSGSALTFDGASLVVGNAGSVLGSASLTLGSHLSVANAGRYYLWSASNAFAWSMNAPGDAIAWYNNSGSEQMRLTSTGLGIGTSSPNEKLEVYGASAGVLRLSTAAKAFNIYTNNSDGTLYFRDVVASANRMALDSSGNLGLGVTPSAWISGSGRAFEIGYTGVGTWAFQPDDVYYLSNAYYSGGFKYGTTGKLAAMYEQLSGSHIWKTAPSGTAGNAISFTQAMMLDASGNLLVGANSASTAYIAVANGGLTSNGGTVPLVFGINAVEKARIDSSGNLLVGTTSTTIPTGSGSLIYLQSPGALYVGHANGAASGTIYSAFAYNGSVIGSITQNGTTGVLYNLTSDYRLKNNPVPVTGAKEFINALQPKTWDWWDGSGKGVGFIAHEFMEVAKYSGNGTKDAVDEDGNPVYQSIQPSSSEVMANLVAYVQELRAEFDAYKATHP